MTDFTEGHGIGFQEGYATAKKEYIEKFIKDIKEINKYYGTTNKLVAIYKKWEGELKK